jgi:hypothetical protein
VADGIRQGRCNVKSLQLSIQLSMLQTLTPEATEAVKAIASAIRLDRNLEYLTFEMQNDFNDEAGVELAEALIVNRTLRMLNFPTPPSRQDQNTDALSVSTYDAFSAMLRVSSSLALKLPPFVNAVGDQRLVDSRNQMRIEHPLNGVGRGSLLSSSQTTRKAWVDALDELNSYDNVDESPDYNISCLYSLLRLNPATCML